MFEQGLFGTLESIGISMRNSVEEAINQPKYQAFPTSANSKSDTDNNESKLSEEVLTPENFQEKWNSDLGNVALDQMRDNRENFGLMNDDKSLEKLLCNISDGTSILGAAVQKRYNTAGPDGKAQMFKELRTTIYDVYHMSTTRQYVNKRTEEELSKAMQRNQKIQNFMQNNADLLNKALEDAGFDVKVPKSEKSTKLDASVKISTKSSVLDEGDKMSEIENMRKLLDIMEKQLKSEANKGDINELKKHMSEWNRDVEKLVEMINNLS